MAPSTSTSPRWPRRCRAPTNSSTAAPTCRTSSACAARVVRRCRRAYTDPLMYQATSAGFNGPRDSVKVVDEGYGIDLAAEIVVVTDDVPMAVTPDQAAQIGRASGRASVRQYV